MNLAIEMYPAFPVNFSNTVRPGDKFFGSVTFNGGSFSDTWLRAN